MPTLTPRVTVAAIVLAATLSPTIGAQGIVESPRTVFVNAFNQAGPVNDLKPSELELKDSGRTRQVLSVEPSRERLRLAIVVDELLAPDGVMRQSTLKFVQQVRTSGDVALFFVGQGIDARVSYTSELSPFVSALNSFSARAVYPATLVRSLQQIAKEQRSFEGRRVIVVIAPEIPELTNVRAEGVFDELREGGAVLHAATFVGWRTSGGTLQQMPATRLEGGDLTQLVERDRVLGDGPKRSGGLRVSSTSVDGLGPALARVAEAIQTELKVTYLVPAGTRSDGRMSVESTRKGVTVRAPTQIRRQ
jgi:hypothetical protein